jgi:hypothetical protein
MVDITFVSTRDALHRVAVHVLARARQQATGRFSLRVTPGGVGTPEHGPDARRVRIRGSLLVVESDSPGHPFAAGRGIDGATLRELADLAAVDLDAPLDVGHDTPPVGDPDAPIRIDEHAAVALCDWNAMVGDVLDRVAVGLSAVGLVATLPRLWPEHFDVAVETEASPSRRVNLGGAPGDGFCHEPYWYVGPWNGDRPGDGRFWNAPFGAFLPGASLGTNAADEAAAFLLEGVARLR